MRGLAGQEYLLECSRLAETPGHWVAWPPAVVTHVDFGAPVTVRAAAVILVVENAVLRAGGGGLGRPDFSGDCQAGGGGSGSAG